MESNQPSPSTVDLLEGSIFLQGGKFKASRESYEKTLQNEADNLEAIYGLGIIYQYEENYAEARKYFQKALDLHGESGAILNSYGIVAAHLGDADAAKQALEKAVFLDPDFLDARKNLAEIYLMTEDYENGINTYREILKQNENDIEALFNIAKLYYAVDDIGSTKYILQKVLEIEPENKSAKAGLNKLEKEAVTSQQ